MDEKCFIFDTVQSLVRKKKKNKRQRRFPFPPHPHQVLSTRVKRICDVPIEHSVLFTNIRSLIPKREDVHSLTDTCNADFVFLTETWLNPDITDSELFPPHFGFHVYRTDRVGKRGGGVLLALNKLIPIKAYLGRNKPGNRLGMAYL